MLYCIMSASIRKWNGLGNRELGESAIGKAATGNHPTHGSWDILGVLSIGRSAFAPPSFVCLFFISISWAVAHLC